MMYLRNFHHRSPDDGAGDETLTPEDKTAGHVPLERFSKVVAVRTAAQADAAAARAEAKAARDEAASIVAEKAAWDAERTGWGATKAELEGKVSDTARRLGLARAGVIDDDHAEALARAYGAHPAEGKPADEIAFWTAIRSGALPPPRTLVGFIPAPATAPQGAPPVIPPPPASGAPNSAGFGVTAEHLSAARVKFEASRKVDDRKAYFDLVDAYHKQAAGRK